MFIADCDFNKLDCSLITKFALVQNARLFVTD
jgi:hypothetical protein